MGDIRLEQEEAEQIEKALREAVDAEWPAYLWAQKGRVMNALSLLAAAREDDIARYFKPYPETWVLNPDAQIHSGISGLEELKEGIDAAMAGAREPAKVQREDFGAWMDSVHDEPALQPVDGPFYASRRMEELWQAYLAGSRRGATGPREETARLREALEEIMRRAEGCERLIAPSWCGGKNGYLREQWCSGCIARAALAQPGGGA